MSIATGPAVEGVPPVEVNVPAEPPGPYLLVTPVRSGSPAGWPVALAVSNVDEVVEKEPNNDIAQATDVPVPGGVTGRIAQKGDIDFYKLKLKKAKHVIEARTLELGSPTDVYMTVRNEKGAEVAKSNAAFARLEQLAHDRRRLVADAPPRSATRSADARAARETRRVRPSGATRRAARLSKWPATRARYFLRLAGGGSGPISLRPAAFLSWGAPRFHNMKPPLCRKKPY